MEGWSNGKSADLSQHEAVALQTRGEAIVGAEQASWFQMKHYIVLMLLERKGSEKNSF